MLKSPFSVTEYFFQLYLASTSNMRWKDPSGPWERMEPISSLDASVVSRNSCEIV